jgi:hypothetical protein
MLRDYAKDKMYVAVAEPHGVKRGQLLPYIFFNIFFILKYAIAPLNLFLNTFYIRILIIS